MTEDNIIPLDEDIFHGRADKKKDLTKVKSFQKNKNYKKLLCFFNSIALVEAIDTTCSINELLLTSVEWVAG